MFKRTFWARERSHQNALDPLEGIETFSRMETREMPNYQNALDPLEGIETCLLQGFLWC